MGAAWSPVLCGAGQATLWQALDRLEPLERRAERALFERNLARCREGRIPTSSAHRQAAEACARRKLWARLTALSRTADPTSLTGVYRLSARDAAGAVEILERMDGTAALSITTAEADGAGCALALPNAWRAGGGLAWKGELAPGAPETLCDVRFRRIGPDLLVEGDTPCRSACVADADYRERFRLQL